VATVAGRPIPLAWVEARLATLLRGRLGRHLPPGESGETQRLRRWIVQGLVTRLVLLHEAEQAGLWSWPDSVSDQTSVWDEAPSLPDDVLARLFDQVTGHVLVPDAEIDAVLERDPDAHRQPEGRQVRYVISDDALRARAWRDALQEGSAPQEGGPVRQGRLWLRRGEWVGPLEDAIFESGIDAVVGPFELEQGWTVARVEALRPAIVPSTGELRARMADELLRYARARAFDDWIDARRAALAVIAMEYEHPGHPVHGIMQHRH
jgi:[acyl-carrier-protein] S-malonyltransferase